MTSAEVRRKFLEFYEARGHVVIPSASLVPEDDPTTLLTSSGMQPLLPYFLGKEHPKGTRIADSQKCVRAEDIGEVGDNRHTTFFEMLGNWSFGDYFKEEQLQWFFEFLTEELKLDPNRLYVTVFAGDEKNNIPRDDESAEIWKNLFASKDIGVEGGRVAYGSISENWWSRSGTPSEMPAGEPGGPDSEVFYDFGTKHDPRFGAGCHSSCGCGRFMEIGNSVFMQYIKQDNGIFAKLPKQNVDFGGGLERITAAVNNDGDVFNVDTLASITTKIKQFAGIKDLTSEHIIADHIRGATFLIADGVEPSNTDRGYIVRRLLRRAIRHFDMLKISKGNLADLSSVVIQKYRDTYPELEQKEIYIRDIIGKEEEKFRLTLEKGLREFEKGADPFVLFTTYGFPIEMTEELAAEYGKMIDRAEFDRKMEEHQALSRTSTKGRFKGGLASTGKMETKYHTATHLLLQALRNILGSHIEQRGSNITAERLRFDFSHTEKLTGEEIEKIEALVNEKIGEDLPVTMAEKDGIKTYSIGTFSVEPCGGPHVDRTGALGKFKIVKEESSSAGVRRIKAVLQ